jgi:hypothetical protein
VKDAIILKRGKIQLAGIRTDGNGGTG